MQKRYSRINPFLIKTDIADYYASIHHFTLLDQCQHVIKDKCVIRLLWQSLNRVHVHQGIHRLIEHKSISRGCPLSPLFSTLYLPPLDQLAREHNIDYDCYIADVVFFFKKQHRLKKCLRASMPALKALHSTYGSWPSLIALNRVEVKLYKRKVNIHTIDKINIGVN